MRPQAEGVLRARAGGELTRRVIADESGRSLGIEVSSDAFFLPAAVSAADGEMDISFQESGRGYYAHLHELERLRGLDNKDYQEYRDKLLAELKEAEENGMITYQMNVVYNDLLSKKDD